MYVCMYVCMYVFLPSDIMLPAERLLAGNSFIVLCLVTLIQPMKSRAVGVKILAM